MRLGLVSSLSGFVAGILIVAGATGALPLHPAQADVEPAMMIGVDLPGGDLTHFALTTPDPGLCRQECMRNNECFAWTFVKPGVQGAQAVCWLKNGNVPAQGVSHTGAISGIKMSGWTAQPGSARVTGDMFLGVDLPGDDIGSFVMQVADPMLCQQACQGRSDCQAWTFVQPGLQNQPAMCWLKSRFPANGVTNRHAISGSRGSAAGGGGGGGSGGGGAGGGGGPMDWGVWASASGGQWGDPCAIQYNTARLMGNRYDGDPGYKRVRTRSSQPEADLDIDQFGRYHKNQPDGVVKMVPCPDNNSAMSGGGGNTGGGGGNNGGGGPTGPLAWMTGTFDTGGGVMQLTPAGGTYQYSNGRLTVTGISGTTMEGIWEQDDSGQRCKDGRYHGRFILNFTEAGFTGLFGYCDEVPAAQGGFYGTRRRN